MDEWDSADQQAYNMHLRWYKRESMHQLLFLALAEIVHLLNVDKTPKLAALVSALNDVAEEIREAKPEPEGV